MFLLLQGQSGKEQDFEAKQQVLKQGQKQRNVKIDQWNLKTPGVALFQIHGTFGSHVISLGYDIILNNEQAMCIHRSSFSFRS